MVPSESEPSVASVSSLNHGWLTVLSRPTLLGILKASHPASVALRFKYWSDFIPAVLRVSAARIPQWSTAPVTVDRR